MKLARFSWLVAGCGLVFLSPVSALSPLSRARPPPLRAYSSPLRTLRPCLQQLAEETPPEQLGGVRKLLTQLKRRRAEIRASIPDWLRRLLKRVLPVLAFALLVASQIRRSRARSVVPRAVEVPFSTFLTVVGGESARVSDMRISLSRFSFLLDGAPAFSRPVRMPMELLWFLHRSGVDFRAASGSSVAGVIQLLFPLLWLGALYTVMRKQLTGATGNVGKRATAKRLSSTDLSFEDVAGIDLAKREVQEVVSMLREPAAYRAAGARLPAGLLMIGPPGTGKTLLARVMAAQAEVPFFYCSGSDFVELFIGRGAARMRSLFKEAAENAPCVIFIDELDALGKQRTLRVASTNDEAEQTLNQMLACMDGLDSSNNGVVVMGATNRYEILDPALTRPGRFDRLVRIELPGEEERYSILRVHVRKLSLASDVQLRRVATAAQGFSGAELAALANEAAIRSVRRQDSEVNMADFNSALLDFTTSRRSGVGGLMAKLGIDVP